MRLHHLVHVALNPTYELPHLAVGDRLPLTLLKLLLLLLLLRESKPAQKQNGCCGSRNNR
jgi:hypothetical protein